jgi:serine/threonine protein kinase
VHSAGYLHNDIKPQNIMINLNASGKTYSEFINVILIDFNVSTKFRDSSRPDKHVNRSKVENFEGNILFSSLN